MIDSIIATPSQDSAIVCLPQVDAHPLSQVVQAASTDAVPTFAWEFPISGSTSTSSSATSSSGAASGAPHPHECMAAEWQCLLSC